MDKAQAAQTIQKAWSDLAAKVIEEFKINGFKPEDVILRPGYRMQYMGQLNDLEISSPIVSAATAGDWEQIVDAFEETYRQGVRQFGAFAGTGLLRPGSAIMRGMVITQKPVLPEDPEGGPKPPAQARLGTRPLYRQKQWRDAVLWKMEALQPGNIITGPAIIESDATTFVVPRALPPRSTSIASSTSKK
ncbi:hypothetical protein ACU4GD_18535 [Cupriavidus basilensis]